MKISDLQRRCIKELKPYSCARDEYKGEAQVFLDANENPFNYPYNRYPDPLQIELKKRIAEIKGVCPEQIMIGNGSDEPIDLAIRIFCEPREDNVLTVQPTYGMYEVCADINGVEYRTVSLNEDFSLDADKLLAAADKNTKIIFLCSPNNPSGNLLNREEVRKVVESFSGIVIIDEAYIDFSPQDTCLGWIDKYPNVIVLHTFSKAWGLAAVRCGMAFASSEIIELFNKVKYPYNVNLLTQEFVLKQLQDTKQKESWVELLIEQRAVLKEKLTSLRCVEKIYPSDANFLLVKTADASAIYQSLMAKGVIVRNRNSVALCNNCLRITIGTPEENNTLINALSEY